MNCLSSNEDFRSTISSAGLSIDVIDPSWWRRFKMQPGAKCDVIGSLCMSTERP